MPVCSPDAKISRPGVDIVYQNSIIKADMKAAVRFTRRRQSSQEPLKLKTAPGLTPPARFFCA